ncbi:hypothetical protein Patl1_17550 [Pistacia atlantica]|uniref:Uncharacterized protein n=1 Tax=Pistacia atlantica TaxID=434234 RepID=A0ACC1C3B3_9ROSI|nr:hypothetical protein Patl1_17550 [Pistacia atlantica]
MIFNLHLPKRIICSIRLVDPRWDLIAGRLPGRTADEIERFWIMRHSQVFAEKRKEQQKAMALAKNNS